MKRRSIFTGRTLMLVVTGIAAGSILGGPAVAHVGRRLPHLQSHLDPLYLNQNEKAADANQLDGLDSSQFLRSTAKAADADLLDGVNGADFLRITGKAADADRLDNLDSTAFVLGASSVSRVASCAGAGFYEATSTFGHSTDSEGLRYIGGTNAVRCAVDLPNNAIVTGVTFTVFDNDGTGDVDSCRLVRTDLTAPVSAESNVSTPVSSSGTPGETTLSAPSLVAANTTVSNGGFGYSLECILESGDINNGVFGGVVTYSVTAANG